MKSHAHARALSLVALRGLDPALAAWTRENRARGPWHLRCPWQVGQAIYGLMPTALATASHESQLAIRSSRREVPAADWPRRDV
jgi:hypothetical protein